MLSVIVGGSIGFAGLLLVFAGFLFARADSLSSTRRADPYRRVAKWATAPFCAFIVIAVLSLSCLENSSAMCACVSPAFKWLVVLTGVYGSAALLFFL